MGLGEIAYDLDDDAFHDLSQDVLECDRVICFDLHVVRSAWFPEYYCHHVFEGFGEIIETETCLR